MCLTTGCIAPQLDLAGRSWSCCAASIDPWAGLSPIAQHDAAATRRQRRCCATLHQHVSTSRARPKKHKDAMIQGSPVFYFTKLTYLHTLQQRVLKAVLIHGELPTAPSSFRILCIVPSTIASESGRSVLAFLLVIRHKNRASS